MHTDDAGQQGGDSAGNGLLSRRQWMQIGAGTAAAAVVAPVVAKESFGQEPWRSGSRSAAIGLWRSPKYAVAAS